MRIIVSVERSFLFILVTFLLFSPFTTYYVRAGIAGPGWLTQGDGCKIRQSVNKRSEHRQEEALIQQDPGIQDTLNPDQLASFVTPDIAELARGLQYDPTLIYDYVHNHIDYVPYFGSLKGATLTYFDGSGNDFDQASLMIALLRASNYAAQYVYGSMTIPYTDLANWLGVDNDAQIIGTVLLAGGFDSRYNDFYTSSANIRRVWVRATIDGSVYDLDPAFKTYQDISSVFRDTGTGMINIDNELAYNRNALLADAQTGATAGSDWIRDLNENAIAHNLKTYSSNLINTIKTEYPNHSMEEIIGGRKIIRSTMTQYPISLPYSPSVIYVWDEIDSYYVSRLNIIHRSCGNGWDFNTDVYTHELSGRRLTLTYSVSNNAPELRLNGILRATGLSTTAGTQCEMKVTIYHPYEGNYGDQEATYNVVSGGSYAIVYNFGGTAESLLQKRQEQVDTYIDQGLDDLSEEVMGESLNIMGMTWMKQVNMTDDVLSALAGTVNTRHHKIGVMAQESGYYIDVPQALVSIMSKQGRDEDKWSQFKVSALIGSAFEHGVLEQLMGSDNPGISTTKIFHLANTGGQKIFYADGTNFSSIISQLQNYSQHTINSMQSYINYGYTFILPQSGDVGVNQWSGTGYIRKYFGGSYGTLGMIISGGYHGGYAGNTGHVIPYYVSDVTYRSLYAIPSFNTSYTSNTTTAPSLSRDPVDMASGAYIYESIDLSLGDAAPRGLSFSRFYNSNQYLKDRNLGNGWTHNYDIYLNRHSHGDPGLGGRQPVDSAALIAQIYVALDLMKNLDSDTTTKQEKLLGWIISSLASKWAVDRLVDNAVTVHMGSRLLQFIKLPNETYSPPPGITTELIDNGGTFNLLERFGTELQFGANDRISQMTDIDGNTLTFHYDTNGLKTVEDTFGRTITLNYGNGKIESLSDSAGRSLSYGYTGDDLTSYTDPEGKVWVYGYGDPNNPHHMTTLSNPLGDITASHTYDSLGRVDTQTVPRQTGSATYNFYFSGFRNVEEDPEGRTTIYYFDRKGRPTGEENELGHKISKEYDGQFHVVKITDPLLNETVFAYDGNQNLIRTTNALLKSTDFKYDSEFRLTDIVDPLLHGSHVQYDDEHHPVLSQFGVRYNASLLPVDSGIFQTGASYYADGLTHTVTDGRGTITTLTYYPNGNPDTSTTGGHPPLLTSFNSIGLMTGLTDQVGTTTTFPEYNNRGQLMRRTDPLLRETIMAYDDTGRLDYIIDRNGDKIDYAYTPTDKVDTIIYKDSSNQTVSTVSFVYDFHDDLREMHDSLGSTHYNYHADHSLSTMTDPNGFQSGYVYDAAGNLTELIYPDNKKVIYTYDALNRLETVTIDWLGRTAIYHYDDAGRLDRVDNFNGTVTDYDYGNANRLTDLISRKTNNSPIADYHFILDGNGNRTQITKNEPIMPVLHARTSTYRYNPERNRLENADGETLTYDDEGQIYTSGSNTAYAFDHEHRLISIQQSAVSYQYYYDGVGNRLKVDRDGNITKYIYDAGGNLLAEADNNGNILRHYIYGGGLMAMVESGQVYTYHFNAVGSTIAMTDSGQHIVNMYAYTPFGVIANEDEQLPQPFKFVGQYGVMSEDNGLYYMRARYYDPESGRFISEDPIGFGGGDVNLYAYVGNNPLTLIDPSGLTVLYWGGGGAVGAGYKLHPNDEDTLTFGSATGLYFSGTSRSGNHVSGLAGTLGAGRMVGITGGGGALVGIHFGDVEDFYNRGTATGILVGPVAIELTFDGDGQSWTGISAGLFQRGIGLGFYGQETRTARICFQKCGT